MKKYSFLKGLAKALTGVLIFGIPVLVGEFPAVANLTIGGIATLVVNFMKVKNEIANDRTTL